MSGRSSVDLRGRNAGEEAKEGKGWTITLDCFALPSHSLFRFPLPSYPVARVQVKVLETEKAHLSQMLLQCKLLHSQEVQLMTEMHRQVTLSCD